jgi:predicted XRE-type DNA-binding protein
VDLGSPPAEASILAIRSDLIAQLRLLIERKQWAQGRPTEHRGVTQSRVSDLIRGKWDKFSVDMLLVFATRAGLQPRLRL